MCSSFLTCAQNAFPCGDDSYFNKSLAPFCDAVNALPVGSSDRQSAEAALQCLRNSVIRIFQEKQIQWRKFPPLPSECRDFENEMFYDAHSQCFLHMLRNASFSPDGARAFLKTAFPTQDRDRDRSLLLDLIAQHNDSSSGLLALRSAIEEKGFVICSTVDVGNYSEIEAIANRISAVLVNSSQANCDGRNSSTGRTIALKLNSTGPDVCTNLSPLVTYASACPVCGDGVVDWPVEVCDDGNLLDDDGCSAQCRVEDQFDCAAGDSGSSKCYRRICGDGVRVAGEDCDSAGEPGCDRLLCIVEDGYDCSVDPYHLSVCASVCGDGILVNGEDCDDHNLEDRDGCSSTCQVEIGYDCTKTYSNSTSMCVLRPNYKCSSGGCYYCGNEILETPEECDNGGPMDSEADGCDGSCRIVPYFDCVSTLGGHTQCRHYIFDLSRNDDTTLGRSIVFTDPGQLIFLAEPNYLDTSRFGAKVLLSRDLDTLYIF